MELANKAEVKATVESVDAVELEKSERPAMEIMEGYIFGKYALNQHYRVEDIQAILDEVKVAKEPVKEEAPLEINT